MTTETPVKSFPIGEYMLVVKMGGAHGAYAMSCALGMHVMPLTLAAATARGEWLDIVAKMRGMAHANVLYRSPVARQYCGCRVCVDAVQPDHAPLAVASSMRVVGRLVVRMCERHTLDVSAIEDVGDDDHATIELGLLVSRTA